MKVKRKRIKRISIIILISLLFLFVFNTKRKENSYSIEYKLNKVNINENYDYTNNFYYYELKYNNIIYYFATKHIPIKQKKLLKKVKIYEDKDYTCLMPRSNYLHTYPLCSFKGDLISPELASDTIKTKLKVKKANQKAKTLENYIIYSFAEKIYIWNYQGFDYINKNIKKIKVFNKDIYEIPQAYKINNYLLVPNYNQNYYFSEVFIINTENFNVKKWTLNYKISYESIVLGTNDKSLFILDKKEKIEYELVPHKEKMRVVGTKHKKGVIYDKSQKRIVSMNYLLSSNVSFNNQLMYEYYIKDNKLYLSYNNSKTSTLISNKKIKEIIYQENEDVYYLVDDILYKYNPYNYEQPLIQKDEWNYNYKNIIFIDN